MKKPGKGKEKKKIGYNYLGMAGIAVIALVLLGSLMVQSKTLQQRLDYYDSKAVALEKSIDSEKERTKEIEAEKEYMKTDPGHGKNCLFGKNTGKRRDDAAQ